MNLGIVRKIQIILAPLKVFFTSKQFSNELNRIICTQVAKILKKFNFEHLKFYSSRKSHWSVVVALVVVVDENDTDEFNDNKWKKLFTIIEIFWFIFLEMRKSSPPFESDNSIIRLNISVIRYFWNFFAVNNILICFIKTSENSNSLHSPKKKGKIQVQKQIFWH